jgi:hypothetical protein
MYSNFIIMTVINWLNSRIFNISKILKKGPNKEQKDTPYMKINKDREITQQTDFLINIIY